jgi:O-antigen ligase
LGCIKPQRPLLIAAFFIWFFVYVPYSQDITGLTPTRLYLENLVFLSLASAMLVIDRNPRRLDGAGLILLVPIAYHLSLFFVTDNIFAKSAFLGTSSIYFALLALAVVLGGRDLSRPAHWISSGLMAISLAVIIQTFGGLGTYSLSIPGVPVLEFGSPSHFGGFGQRNVMASFVACLVMWSVADFLSKSDTQVGYFQLIALAAGAFVVTVSSSKIGILGLAVGCAFALVWLRFISSVPIKRPAYGMFGAVIIGVLIGYLLANIGGRATGIDRFATEMAVGDSGIVLQSSFSTRINAWYSALISWWSSPLMGVGPGRFLHGFQDAALGDQLPLAGKPLVFNFFHSHSMLLQTLVEGGLVRLLFTVVPLMVWFCLVLKSWKARFFGLTAMSPILLHSLTEYPFESSLLHWLLIGLIPLSIRAPKNHDSLNQSGQTKTSRPIYFLLFASMMITVWFQFTTLKAITILKASSGINNELLQSWFAGDEKIADAMSHTVVGPYATQLVYQQASVVLAASSQKNSLDIMRPFALDALEWFPSKNAYELVLMTTTNKSSQEYSEISDRYERLKALHTH